MKTPALREQTSEELAQLLRDTSDQLFDLRVKSGTGDSTTPPTHLRILRRDIARIKTVVRERKVDDHG